MNKLCSLTVAVLSRSWDTQALRQDSFTNFRTMLLLHQRMTIAVLKWVINPESLMSIGRKLLGYANVIMLLMLELSASGDQDSTEAGHVSSHLHLLDVPCRWQKLHASRILPAARRGAKLPRKAIRRRVALEDLRFRIPRERNKKLQIEGIIRLYMRTK